MSYLEVLAPGPLATIQDRGRPGHAHEGVPPSGAADAAAHALANRLVGNPEGDATIEATLGGLRVRLGAGPTRYVAVSGAPAPLRVGGRPAPLYAPVALRPGEDLELGAPPAGLRTYLAVGGGIAVDAELGSRSTDVLSGMGPAPLHTGDRLPLGPPGAPPAVDVAPPPDPAATVGLRRGPRDDWLDEAGWARLLGSAWTVGAASNRVGVRLQGPTLVPARGGELPPEGLVTGAVQLPSGGAPIVFLTDHPVTGGYPVVAVVDDASLGVVAQARPGARLRFSTTSRPGLPSTPR